MKEVNFVLHNIQSHAHTEFSLKPGLNFILANDNNVGKSTIFKAILFASRVPRVSNLEAREILRVGEQQGYISFAFDNQRVILWIFRESKDSIKVFFEIRHPDGSTTRSSSCPKELLEALDIVQGSDGVAVNFNDADSVQLVVQDTSKNDEVLARVLVDLRVEAIRENVKKLSKEITMDYRSVQDKYDYTTRSLAKLRYNESVDLFNDERSLLAAAAEALDLLDAGCVFSTESDVQLEDLDVFGDALQLATELEPLKFIETECLDELRGEIEMINEALATVTLLVDVHFSDTSTSALENLPQIQNALEALGVLSSITQAFYGANNAVQARYAVRKAEWHMKSIAQTFKESCQIVNCPIKGEVYYSAEECIPVND